MSTPGRRADLGAQHHGVRLLDEYPEERIPAGTSIFDLLGR